MVAVFPVAVLEELGLHSSGGGAVGRNAHQQGVALVEGCAVGIVVTERRHPACLQPRLLYIRLNGVAMVEMPVYCSDELLLPLGIMLSIIGMTCHSGHLHHIGQTLSKETVVDVQYALATFVHSLGDGPVAEKPSAPLGVEPRLQDVVFAVVLDVFQPALHLVVVAVDECAVTVVEVGAPRCLDDESLPVGASAGAEGRGNVRQVAGAVHCIAPSLQPVGIGGAHIPEGLQRVGR